MKKLFIIIACAVTVLSLCSFTGCSGEAEVLYKLTEDGTYAVSGVSGNKNRLYKYEIPETYSEDGENYAPVTEIAESAFYGCRYLSEVTIPDSVTTIGNFAFTFCGFEEITIPDSVTQIGASAFAKCEVLREIVIPESVQSLGAGAFFCCSRLEKAVIKASVKTILNYTFANSYAVEETAYTSSSMTKIYLPASVEKINLYAFNGNFYLTDIYYAGTEEQWNNIKYYNFENNTSGTGTEEVEYKAEDVFISNPEVHFNSNY